MKVFFYTQTFIFPFKHLFHVQNYHACLLKIFFLNDKSVTVILKLKFLSHLLSQWFGFISSCDCLMAILPPPCHLFSGQHGEATLFMLTRGVLDVTVGL